MRCLDDGVSDFLVLAGPDPCADRPEAVAEFRSNAGRAGVRALRVLQTSQTQFRFELDADSPESACSLVTTLFREVYGLNWWAQVTSLCAAREAIAEAAARN
jgi:hypothetical protein